MVSKAFKKIIISFRKLTTLLLLFLPAVAEVSHAGNSLVEISQRCKPLSSEEQTLYSSDFRWGMDLVEMLQRWTAISQSPKRLGRRAYWDAEKKILKLPYESFRGGDIEVSETFIQTIARHIDQAFLKQYIDAVFFPDMGHSHLLIPQQLMTDIYSKYPVPQMSSFYRDVFRDSRIKVLYHTAEQLQTLDEAGQVLKDPHIQWRHHSRNIAGSLTPSAELEVLQNPASNANTVSEVPGYFWWGAGFNLSAHKDGCFEYSQAGHRFFFDLSMYDLEPDPGADPW